MIDHEYLLHLPAETLGLSLLCVEKNELRITAMIACDEEECQPASDCTQDNGTFVSLTIPFSLLGSLYNHNGVGL